MIHYHQYNSIYAIEAHVSTTSKTSNEGKTRRHTRSDPLCTLSSNGSVSYLRSSSNPCTTEYHKSASGATPNVTKHSAFSKSPVTPAHASMASRVSKSVTVSANVRRTSLDITPLCSESTGRRVPTLPSNAYLEPCVVGFRFVRLDPRKSPRTRSRINSSISENSNDSS